MTPETQRERRGRLQELEQRVLDLLRHPVTRWVGLTLGVSAFAFLVIRLLRDDDGLAALRALGPAAWVTAAVGFTVFHVAAIQLLRLVGGGPPARVWASAQLAKYLPVPASAAAGMVGTAVRHGAGATEAVGVMVRQTLALVAGAALVAAPATASWLGRRVAIGEVLGILAGLLVAGGALAVAVRRLPAPTAIGAAVISVLGWSVLAGVLGTAVSSPEDPWVVVGSAYAAGWIAGQIVVPVPAGLGVREAAMVALLHAHIGFERAVAIAIVTRLLHVLSDAAVAAVVFAASAASRRT